MSNILGGDITSAFSKALDFAALTKLIVALGDAPKSIILDKSSSPNFDGSRVENTGLKCNLQLFHQHKFLQ